MTNLLYMQDELLELESTLRDLEAKDTAEKRVYAVNLSKLRDSEGKSGDEAAQFNIFKQMQSKIKEYSV